MDLRLLRWTVSRTWRGSSVSAGDPVEATAEVAILLATGQVIDDIVPDDMPLTERQWRQLRTEIHPHTRFSSSSTGPTRIEEVDGVRLVWVGDKPPEDP